MSIHEYAISEGHLSKHSFWKTDKTLIQNTLTALDNNAVHAIDYYSVEHYQLIQKAMDSEF